MNATAHMIFRSVQEMREAIGQRSTARAVDLTVIVPCHNYARFLADCLTSLAESTARPARVIVIDDASDDDPRRIAEEFGVEFHRVEFGSLTEVCRFGFGFVRTKYVAFVDADDEVDPHYFDAAIQAIEADRNCAFAFPPLEAFGNVSGPYAGTDAAPKRITAADIESRNWCPMCTVLRSELLRQSATFARDRDPLCYCEDWRQVRDVLRSGPWHGAQVQTPLRYRIHGQNDHVKKPRAFSEWSDLMSETITIVVAFSGRWPQWERLRAWILSQSWPLDQTRLLILNSTLGPLTADQLGLSAWSGQALQIERRDVGRKGLADELRPNNPETCFQVEAAVAGLYNYASGLIPGEWILFLEDDVIPQRPDAIAKLMASVGPGVAAITGAYQHRYHHENAVAFTLPYRGLPSLLPMDGPDVEQIGGSGFGCLLARKSVFRKIGLAGDNNLRPHYDCEASARVADLGFAWMMDRTVRCDHMTNSAQPE